MGSTPSSVTERSRPDGSSRSPSANGGFEASRTRTGRLRRVRRRREQLQERAVTHRVGTGRRVAHHELARAERRDHNLARHPRTGHVKAITRIGAPSAPCTGQRERQQEDLLSECFQIGQVLEQNHAAHRGSSWWLGLSRSFSWPCAGSSGDGVSMPRTSTPLSSSQWQASGTEVRRLGVEAQIDEAPRPVKAEQHAGMARGSAQRPLQRVARDLRQRPRGSSGRRPAPARRGARGRSTRRGLRRG